MRKGVRCYVLLNTSLAAMGRDFRIGGVPSLATEVLLVGEGVPLLDAPDGDMPELELRSIEAGGRTCYCASPVREGAVQGRGQFGGHFIVARGGRSDRDRLPYETDGFSDFPIGVHDR